MKIEKHDPVTPAPIRTVAEWGVLAGPKASYQWKEGRSAWELANAWCGNGVAPPRSVLELLDSRDETRGFECEIAWPEHEIKFDTFGGPRNADLALLGSSSSHRIAITIEAKADEPFGKTVQDTFRAALVRAVQSPGSGGVRRIEELARALFEPSTDGDPEVASLRYQLLTATVGTLAFADQHGADVAVLLIHEFITEETADRRHEQNASDYRLFLKRLGVSHIPDGSHLLGPIAIPGGNLFPGGRKFFVGTVSTNRRKYAAPSRRQQGQFKRYIGVDYSGAETPDASLKGLRVYRAGRDEPPCEVEPPTGPKKYWTRKAVAHWVVQQLSEDIPTIVGVDHGFSFPLAYFEKYGVAHSWDAFLDDFCEHWPTDVDHTYVDFVRDGAAGNGAARMGSTKWKRIAELRSKSAKSLFHFDVQGSVAKSTHAGLPWLRFIRRQVRRPLHFWPFDGWAVPDGSSAMVEVYPRLWNRQFASADRNADQQDAWAVAEWLRRADASGALSQALHPPSDPAIRRGAEVEGWILGVE